MKKWAILTIKATAFMMVSAYINAATITVDIDPDTGEKLDTPEYLSVTISSNSDHVTRSGASGNPYLAFTRERYSSDFLDSSLTNWSITGDVSTVFEREPGKSAYDEVMTAVVDFTIFHVNPPDAHTSTGDPLRFKLPVATNEPPDIASPGANLYRYDSELFSVPHRKGHADNYLVDFEADFRIINGAWQLFDWELQVKGSHSYTLVPEPNSLILIFLGIIGIAANRKWFNSNAG